MAFDFHQKLLDEDGEIDEEAAGRYVEDLTSLFAESPEGAALEARGIEPGCYLGMFLDYELRYVGVEPAEMDAGDIQGTLDVFAQKVTGKAEELDQVIPELEAWCDFVQRAFGLEQADIWKRELQREAGSFRRNVRDPRHWGMAKSMMMEGLARGFDLSTEAGINEWMQILQGEQLARVVGQGAGTGAPKGVKDLIRRILGRSTSEPAPAEAGWVEPSTDWSPGGRFGSQPFQLGSGSSSRRAKAKEKAKRRMRQASRRRNRR